MNNILGENNTLVNYLLVLFIYALMFLLIRYPKPKLELNFRSNFIVLCILWFFLMFTGNYLFYRLGLMAFLPWLNNFLHSFIWVGICLSWLFYSSIERPLLEQFVLFAFTSFIVKMAEHSVLGTWSMDQYLGIHNPYAYIIVMSIVDGFYPVISRFIIKKLAKKSTFGVYEFQVA